MDNGQKHTRLEVKQRRERVRRLAVRGLSPEQIAEREGVTCRTIRNDLKCIQDAGVKVVKESTAEELAVLALETYQELQREAWLAYHRADDDLKAEPSKITRKQWAVERGIAQDKIRMAQGAMDSLFEKIGVFKSAPKTIVEVHQYIAMFDKFTDKDWGDFLPKLLDYLEKHPDDLVSLLRWGTEKGLLGDTIEGDPKQLGGDDP